MSEPWFKPKSFGYGASPANGKGWALTIGFVLFVLVLAHAVQAEWLSAAIGLPIGLAVTAGFIVLVKAKTDGRWRWRSWAEYQADRR
jgi:hypothetical protein